MTTNVPERSGDAGPTPSEPAQPVASGQVLLVTGMSGAGKSSALKALEDLGYEAVDNLPLSLVGAVLDEPRRPWQQRDALAIAVDVRTRDFSVAAFLEAKAEMESRLGLAVRCLFLDCDDEALRRRYTETRRRHPLADRPTLPESIAAERQLLQPIADLADRVLDTTYLSATDLRRVIAGEFRLEHAAGMVVTVISFSYARGLPREADLVFDVRFLSNPHYVPELRPLTGRDAAVGAYVAADAGFADFFAALTGMLRLLLPRYRDEGKSYLTIAFGCTGGRHRSVYLAERLAALLTAEGQTVGLVHREVGGGG